MEQILDFIEKNPLLVGVIITVVESALMPLVPVKWNGVAVFLLSLVKSKFGKVTPKEVPLTPEQERTLQIRTDMENAVNARTKESAAKKLAE